MHDVTDVEIKYPVILFLSYQDGFDVVSQIEIVLSTLLSKTLILSISTSRP